MRRRQWVRLAASGAVGALGLSSTACRSGPTEEDPVTLRLIAADYGDRTGRGGSRGYWRTLVERFERKHRTIRVTVRVHPWHAIDEEVARLVSSGAVPDLAQARSFARYAVKGILHPADDVLSIPAQANLLTQIAAGGEVRRVQYGLPLAASVRMLFYNKRLFVQAGLDPDRPPRTWHELQHAALALRAAGVEIPYGLPLGPEEAEVESMIWILGNDGGYTDAAGGYVIDSAQNRETFSWLRDALVGRGLTQDDPGGTNARTVFEHFSRGRVGMLHGPPDLMRRAEAGGVDFGVTTPCGKREASRITMGSADWMMAFRKNGHREQITRFLDFVYGDRGSRDFVERHRQLPVTTSGVDWMSGEPRYRKLRPFLDELSTAEYLPDGTASWAKAGARIRNGIGEAVAEYAHTSAVLGELQREALRAEAETGEAR